VGDSHILSEFATFALSHASRAGFFTFFNLGFRFAPPQGGVPGRAFRLGCETLCFHPLRGFWKYFSPWVSPTRKLMNKHPRKSLLLAIALALTSAGAHSVRAQDSRSRAPKSSPVQSEPKHEKIRARAGESVSAVAERAGVDPDELAQLNNLSLKTKLRKGQSLLLPAAAASQSQNGPRDEGLPNGKLIKFEDGGTMRVDNAWWRGEEVWYSSGGVTATLSRKVKSIEPIFVARVDSAKKAAPPPLKVLEKPTESVATWIYLVGGARFKVDGVTKTSDGAWYQHGNLVSFLASARIERIERELPGEPEAAGSDVGWTSGNPTIDQLIKTNGSRFGVDPYLVFLVIEQESHFHPRALSPKGAQGLMQLMPGTARRFAVRRPLDPVENIRGGTQYLKELLTMFRGRVDLALASYNAGEGRVISYGNKVPPFQETQNYVKRINQRYRKGSNSKKGASATGVVPALAEDRP
jgi:LysM repeat protein